MSPTGGSLQAEDARPAIGRGVRLLRDHAIEPGARVVMLLGNNLATFGLLAAASLEGVVAVPLPPELTDAELAPVLLDADPVAVIADPVHVRATATLEAVEAGVPAGVLPGVLSGVPPGPLPGAPAGMPPIQVVRIDAQRLAALHPADPSADWPRTRPMAYTSGTTGARKGVHAGVHDAAWGEAMVRDEHAAFDHRHGERHLVVSPLYHSGPLRFALTCALTGGTIAVLPGFDAAAWRHALRDVRPTSLFCVPTHLHRLLALPQFDGDDLGSLDLLAHAGAPCPVPLKRRVLELAPEGSVWEFYGSTEGQFTIAPPALWQAAPGTVGVARPDRSIEVRRSDGSPCAPSEVGTVWARVPDHARFSYWRDAQRTQAAWDGDAFTVGDLGHLDDVGRLFLDGRPGDLVISGGVNVYPAEVERVLLAQPGVAEAVAFGVADPEWGERLLAAVVPWPEATLDPAALREALRAQVSRAKLPREVLVVDELPRTATGKLRRVGLPDALGLQGTRW